MYTRTFILAYKNIRSYSIFVSVYILCGIYYSSNTRHDKINFSDSAQNKMYYPCKINLPMQKDKFVIFY